VNGLTIDDLAVFERIGCSPALVERAGVARVTDHEAREDFGIAYRGRCEGILFPYISPITGRRTTCRLRRDHPDADELGKPVGKYLTPGRDRRSCYFGPGAGDLLQNAAVPVVFVEAEKSVLTLIAACDATGRTCLPIGLGGCWGWRGVTGKTTDATGARVDERGPLSDFGLLALDNREAVILFDSNARSNPQVRRAVHALTAELHKRGARVRVGSVPADGQVNGPDDYNAQRGPEALWALIDDARTAPALRDCSVDELLTECGLNAISDPPDLDALEQGLGELGELVRHAPQVRRQTVRLALMKRFKAAKIEGAAGLVDAALKRTETEPDSDDSPFKNDAAWPATVDGASLLDAIRSTLTRYLVLPPGGDVAISLWILHSYLMSTWQLSPLLVVWSVVKGCGKSNVLTLVSCLCPRAFPSTNVTVAAMFRLIERYQPTLIVDEMDGVLSENAELRSLVNGAYMRRFSRVMRCHPETLEPMFFSAWCAKTLALIGKLPDMTASRAILIEMKRKHRDEIVESIREDRIHDDLLPLRQQAARWAADIAESLAPDETAIPGELPDRPRNNWRPLLCVADAAGGHWPETARRAARQLVHLEPDDNDAPGVRLLADIQRWFLAQDAENEPAEVAETAVLLAALVALEERPWAEWRQGKPLSAVALARLLKPFGIHPAGNVRVGAKVVKAYRRCSFEDAWARYCSGPLVNEPLHATNVTNSASIDDSHPLHRRPGVADQNERRTNGSRALLPVAAPESGQADAEVIL